MFGLFKPSNNPPLSRYLKSKLGIRPSSDLNVYEEALRHKSVAKDLGLNDNERLEFLGDAVFDLIVAQYLYQKFPKKDEGLLTQMKSRIVSRKTLGSLGLSLGLTEMVSFVDGKYVNKRTICGNAIEALIGAMYIDLGFKKTAIAVRRILNDHLDLVQLLEEDQDFKSQILIMAQKTKSSIAFNLLNTAELGHARNYLFEVIWNGKSIGQGEGPSKKKAEQAAAEQGLFNLTEKQNH